MDQREVKLLRAMTENRAVRDLKRGRVTGPVRWALVDVAMSTGLRVSEIAALKVGDVNLKQSSLKVTRLKRKNSKPETLAIGPDLAEHLREFIEWKQTVGQPTGKNAPLFVGKRGPLTAAGLQQTWKRAVADADLPRELSIHCARHTLATHLLAKTKNLRQVQKQLGHASPATTANMYADVTFDEMKDGVTGLYDD